jgi:hypothetical protein
LFPSKVRDTTAAAAEQSQCGGIQEGQRNPSVRGDPTLPGSLGCTRGARALGGPWAVPLGLFSETHCWGVVSEASGSGLR